MNENTYVWQSLFFYVVLGRLVLFPMYTASMSNSLISTPTFSIPYNLFQQVMSITLALLDFFSIIVDNITNHVSLKLIGQENYLLWDFVLFRVFNCQRLMGFVDGSINPLPSHTMNTSSQSTFLQRSLLELVLAKTKPLSPFLMLS